MRSRYHAEVDPEAANNAHAMALGLVGWSRRVLELGAASGHVTRVLVERHCEVTTIEREADVAQELVGLADKVIVGDLNDPQVLEDLPEGFDVVLAGDVLEHLIAPEQVLRRAVRLLAPGGRVVISLPNVAHADVRFALLQGRWRYRPWGLLDETHIRFFTRETIETMVEQAGLVITEIRRVRYPAFETELGIDRQLIPTAIVEEVLSDPEAETYQFVVEAARYDTEQQTAALARKGLNLEVQLQREQIGRALAESDAAALREQVAERGAALAQMESLRAQEHAAHRAEVDSLTAQLSAVGEELNQAQAQLASARQEVAVAREELGLGQTQLAAVREEAESAARGLAAVSSELAATRGTLSSASRDLRRVEESVTWQSFLRLRGTLFRAAGGERSMPVRVLQATLRGFGRLAGVRRA